MIAVSHEICRSQGSGLITQNYNIMKTIYNTKNIAKAAGLLVIGILVGWLFFGGSSPESTKMEQHIAETHTDAEGNIVYTCVMHPQVRTHEPGNCPICGMELVPVNSVKEGKKKNPQALSLSPVAMKLADVETVPVVLKPAVKSIRLPGKVTVDERSISVIAANFSGRVEELYVNFTGAYVQQGDRLASVYAPALVTAQKELLQAYKTRSSNPALYRAARQKLRNWELSEQQIEQIIQSGEPKTNFVIRADQSGYVLQRNVAVGDHITEGKALFKIADLSEVWVVFQAYESDLQGIDENEEIRFTVEAYPGRTFEADITYIDPVINPKRRTVSIRTEVSNERGMLKPNMLAQGVISATLSGGEEVLQIPQSAVLWTGKRSLVYVKDPGSPTFTAREVVLGSDLGENYIIKEGLEKGELVVVQGNFMIDAAAQLAGKKSMMNPEGGGSAPGMPGMDMGEMDMKNGDEQMQMK